ncbi:MAG TPA: dipeptide/oligopeptide/nickel ABC transporter ATP-binding protein [Dehalococcoidia bacterium]|nr:dipeptide/oligopeptide/nickel ABC transporter ATP-binding protein [Dehalococcoidia bacterium]
MSDDIVLKVENLRTHFHTKTGIVKAVDGIDFELRRGETLGVVGESGSGKSMTAWSILGMVPKPAGRIETGRILYHGEDLLQKTDDEMRQIRGSGICMVMQDPLTSLNPVLTIKKQLTETLELEYEEKKESLLQRAIGLLSSVNIPAPETRVTSYPHEMSGGMRQRVVGAISISRSPDVLIADEPTTSLDVTIQLQYLKLLKDIQEETGVGIIFITHDFGIVAKMCDRVAVMYAGHIIEQAEVTELFDNPLHPYTKALLRSVPDLDDDVEMLPTIDGQPPDLANTPSGCVFRDRCPDPSDDCRDGNVEMGLIEVSPGHWVDQCCVNCG